uniref:Leucine-rich repeat-containing protein n=2 Tax=Rhizophora mucronata TaxID=61149 RepID=A0A2P2JH99_RHIMU
MASAAAGAGLELAFATFLDVVLQVVNKNVMFKPTLKRLGDTLQSMTPKIKQIEQLNMELDRPKEEIQVLKAMMNRGRLLVLKCSTINRYNYIKKPFYTKKLLKLESSIRRYISIDLHLQHSVDQKETYAEVRQISFGMRRLQSQLEQLSMGSSNSGSFRKSAVGGVCSPPGLKVDPVGLEIPLRELKRKLLDDYVPLIVLSAPGGCGKTTLAVALCQDSDVKEKFKDNIFFVTVSKSPNLLVIVQRLFQHHGCELPEFQGEEDLIILLENFLREMSSGPILLVLDDVWSGSQSVIDKLKFKIENYRILVTSRSELAVNDSTFKLQPLNDADAMTLFRHSALSPDGNFCICDQDVNKILSSCSGFPLAISVVGKTLRRKRVAEWRKKAKECSTAASVLSNPELKLLDCLQKSVDALDDKPVVKECYMDLGSFPEDQRIPVTTLIDMWVERHKIDEDGAVANLYELSDQNLVDLVIMRKDSSDSDGSYTEHFATQHDILRELAILQSSTESIEHRKRIFLHIPGNNVPEWWKEEKQLFINGNLLSICTDEMFSSSWCSIQAPEVEVLYLNFRTKAYTLPKFMETMKRLNVLIITNCGISPVELTNFLLLSSASGVRRLRLEKLSLPSFLLNSVRMKNLQKISLVMCNVSQAFGNLFAQMTDAFPNLVEVLIDYCNDLVQLPAGFCNLILLKKLSITNCHKLSALPDDIAKLQNLEVLRLNSCIELLELPESIGRLDKLSILDISDCLSMARLPESIGGLRSLNKLYMIDCSSCKLPASASNLFNLNEVICDEETAASWEDFTPFLPELLVKVHRDINLNWLR